MDADASAQAPGTASIASGIPLAEEPGLGALSIPGYLREVTARFAGREALVRRWPLEPVSRWLERIRSLPPTVINQMVLAP